MRRNGALAIRGDLPIYQSARRRPHLSDLDPHCEQVPPPHNASRNEAGARVRAISPPQFGQEDESHSDRQNEEFHRRAPSFVTLLIWRKDLFQVRP